MMPFIDDASMQVSNKHPFIAREGWIYLALLAIATIILSSFEYYVISSVIFVAMLFLIFMYRDPERVIPSEPLSVVSPIDGIVERVSDCCSELLDEPAQCVLIRVNYFGVYSSRSPTEGKVLKQAIKKNQNKVQFFNWVQTDEGDNILWEVKSLGLGWISFYVQTGERIGQGQRCGFLPFFAKVDVYLPKNALLLVKVGDKVTAGESVLARLTHKPNTSIFSESEKVL